MKEIAWQPRARKQLKKVGDAKTISAIIDAVETLSDFPNVDGVKALVNHRCTHRLRVGNYRVLFNALDIVDIISIEEVRKRNERTYK